VSPRVFAVTGFGLTTRSPERLARFYEALGFTAAPSERINEPEIALFGLPGGGTRLPLRLGNACITLDCFDEPGREYPTDATAADLCFQHFAIVTDDAAAAWKHAMELGATAISTEGPVTLPASSGGVTACKLRDPEGHPLEFLQFPPESGMRWQGEGLLGIDHSAISVSNAGLSERFYVELGMVLQSPTVNQGQAQEALDALQQPVVDVVPMMPSKAPPHLELLAYRTPVGRAYGITGANDVAATRTIWASDCDALVRDPDGHLHVLRKGSPSE
jgi:catechol 2,3-dioxygenase-like lactoylglutathione lyase family enzyme